MKLSLLISTPQILPIKMNSTKVNTHVNKPFLSALLFFFAFSFLYRQQSAQWMIQILATPLPVS